MGLNDTEKEEEVSFKNVDFSKQEDFVKFSNKFAEKVRATTGLQKTIFYSTYLETFFKELTADVGPDEMKKVIAVLNTVYNEKVKAAKPSKNKKKNKASLLVEKRDKFEN